MSTKHDTLDSWVAAFEKWSGLKVGERRARYNRDDTAELDIVTPTGVLVTTLTVSVYTMGDEGWSFGSSTSVFPNDWKTLCRL